MQMFRDKLTYALVVGALAAIIVGAGWYCKHTFDDMFKGRESYQAAYPLVHGGERVKPEYPTRDTPVAQKASEYKINIGNTMETFFGEEDGPLSVGVDHFLNPGIGIGNGFQVGIEKQE